MGSHDPRLLFAIVGEARRGLADGRIRVLGKRGYSETVAIDDAAKRQTRYVTITDHYAEAYGIALSPETLAAQALWELWTCPPP